MLKPNGILIFSFDMKEDEIPSTWGDFYVSNFEEPLMALFENNFVIRNFFVGKTSWSNKNVCSIALHKS